eukprot:TRINITY_DN1541_c0_g1_i12.p1 TRINITY_DN1541_c0_g1~~TRINITY_DN1541_c0_g1_i12.p1  ORF type:complete len:183 (-),score=46.90 TRINITY_DN1541_c0_g1_i12:62-610(-)
MEQCTFKGGSAAIATALLLSGASATLSSLDVRDQVCHLSLSFSLSFSLSLSLSPCLQSRSRSPHREAKRARARSPTPEKEPERKWKRPAPGTGKGRGHAAVADKAAAKKAAKKKAAERELTEEEKMMAAMGIPIGFDTTKGKLTDPSTNMSGARRQTKRTYRQYMNRRGGFNRPLEPEKLRK